MGMTIAAISEAPLTCLMAQAGLPPSVLFCETEIDLWPYRRRTTALLRRYGRCSVEVGRVPSLLGREFFRSRVTSYTMRNFEDVVIFVTDMEQAIDKLNLIDKKLLAMNVLEEYTQDEMARILSCNPKTIRRQLQDPLVQLSRILLAGGLLDELPMATKGEKSCQEGKNWNFDVSDSNDGRNKRDYALDTRLPVWYCIKHEFYFFFRFGAGFVCPFKCVCTAFTISGWKRCFSASSSVISIGRFFGVFGIGDLMVEAI